MGVGHVHEGAGLVDAAADGVGVAGQGGVPGAGGVRPLVVVRGDRELVGTHHVLKDLVAVGNLVHGDLFVGEVEGRACAEALELPLDLLGHVHAGGGGGLLVDGGAGQSAVAGRAVEVAGGVDQVQDGAHGLGAVADLVGGEVEVDAAVAPGLALGTGGPLQERLLDGDGVEAGDLGAPLGRAVLHGLHQVGPHGTGDVLGAVGQGDLMLALKVEVDAGLLKLPVGQRRQVALLRGALVHDGHLVAGGGDVVAAFPLRGVGVPVHQTALAVVGVLVPSVELAGRAALDQVHLLEQAGLELVAGQVGRGGDGGGEGEVTAAGGLHVLDDEKRCVGPALHELPVHQVMLEHEVLPAVGQSAVRAGAQVQPVVGLLAGAGEAGVNDDVRVCLGEGIHEVAAGVVVVGVLRRGAPLHVHAGTVAQGHPRSAVDGGDPAHEAARALADLGGDVRVGRVEQPLVEGVGAVDPLARGAAHVEDGLATVLVDDLGELLTDGLHGLFPADAHPAGLLALGVRALHGVVDARGVIGGLDRCLALGAVVARRLERRLVTLGLDDAAVLHGDPDAAFHLAAAAAAAADALDLVLAVDRARVFGQSGTGAHDP